jgi:hypothetical protein
LKERKLNYRFHNPNSAEVAADYILKVFIEADGKKVDKAFRELAEKSAGKEGQKMDNMREGILVYDQTSERYQIQYGTEDFSHGLHCGECLDVLQNGNQWIRCRMEFSHEQNRWYLVGTQPGFILDGATVRYTR